MNVILIPFLALLLTSLSLSMNLCQRKEVGSNIAGNHYRTAISPAGFETWICVQNPGETPAEIEMDFMTNGGEVQGPRETIPAHTRRSYFAGNYVHSHDVSTRVTATRGEIVCERAMYWGNRQGGHDSIGTTAPAPVWYLAEGCTEAGDNNYTGSVKLEVAERAGVDRWGDMVTSGVPLPYDFDLHHPEEVALYDRSGSPVPCQVEIKARWGGPPEDDSRPAKWVLLDFPSDPGANQSKEYFLRKGHSGANPPQAVRVSDDGTTLRVNTGAANFSISRDSFNLFDAVEVEGVGTVISPSVENGFFVYSGGGIYSSSYAPPSFLAVEKGGPLHAVVAVKGAHRSPSGEELLHYTARLHFYAGSSRVRIFYTLKNNNSPLLDDTGQPQCWDIGCPESEVFSGMDLRLHPQLGASPIVTLDPGEGSSPPFTAPGGDLTIYQDSSGTPFWNVHQGHHPRPQSYVTFRGWRAREGDRTVGWGDHSQPWLDISGDGRGITLGLRDFWQQHPKALRSHGGEAQLSLFPEEYGGDFNFRPGEQKTHEVLLYFHAGETDTTEIDRNMAMLQFPLFALAAPEWYAQSGALGRITPVRADPVSAAYENQNRAAFEPSIGPTGRSLLGSIEENDFYGWCDYGDVPLDFEAPSGQMNLKYNFDLGMIQQFLRSGDYRWWSLAEPACRHVADEDLLHYEGPIDHWADGGYFGHSYHGEPGDSNPHRNYGAPHPDLAFSVCGCLAYYYLTGYELARESAFEVIENIRFRFENSFGRGSGEGFAEAYNDYGSYSFRPFANGLRIMTEAYEATGDGRYLSTAEWIIQCSHYAGDPFLAAPRRGMEGGTSIFSLDLFTFALGRFLDMISAAGIADRQNAAIYLVQLVRHESEHCWRLDRSGYQGFPYGWLYDGRIDDSFGPVNLCNWHLLSADCLAYAYIYGGGGSFVSLAEQAFRTGSEVPNGPGTEPGYWSTKESVNAACFGQVFLSLQP